MTAKVFPMVTMMGMMVLIISLVISIALATLSYDYWNHSIATQLNPSNGGLLTDHRPGAGNHHPCPALAV